MKETKIVKEKQTVPHKEKLCGILKVDLVNMHDNPYRNMKFILMYRDHFTKCFLTGSLLSKSVI